MKNSISLANSSETNAVRTCAGAEARRRAADRSRGRPNVAERSRTWPSAVARCALGKHCELHLFISRAICTSRSLVNCILMNSSHTILSETIKILKYSY